MRADMVVIGIDGPSHAGKSFLAAHLQIRLSGVRVFPDYVDFAGGDDMVPATPRTDAEELEALRFFQDLDKRRTLPLEQGISDGQIVILDRTYHTILAHRFALDILGRNSVFAESLLAYTQAPYPLTFHIYLDTPEDILALRRPLRGESSPTSDAPLIFDDPTYVEAYRAYFTTTLANPLLHWLDGRQQIDALADDVMRLIGVQES